MIRNSWIKNSRNIKTSTLMKNLSTSTLDRKRRKNKPPNKFERLWLTLYQVSMEKWEDTRERFRKETYKLQSRTELKCCNSLTPEVEYNTDGKSLLTKLHTLQIRLKQLRLRVGLSLCLLLIVQYQSLRHKRSRIRENVSEKTWSIRLTTLFWSSIRVVRWRELMFQIKDQGQELCTIPLLMIWS